MSKDITIKELHTLLEGLIEDGYGNREFQMYYDTDYAYTTIPKGSRILVLSKSIRFSDYENPNIDEEGKIENILKKLGE